MDGSLGATALTYTDDEGSTHRHTYIYIYTALRMKSAIAGS